MAVLKSKYLTGATLTCTLASLANNGARESTVVSNTTDLALDALLMIVVKSGATGVSATGYVDVWVYGSVNAGTDYTEGATGADAAITPTVPPNLRMLGRINVVANAVTYKGGPWSVAAAFGGVLPEKWGIVIENKSGAALDATEANHKKLYQHVQQESV